MRKINRKGSLIDLFYIAIVLVFFGVAVLIGTKIASEFQEGIAANPTYIADAPRAVTETENLVNNYSYSINSAFLFLTIFLALVTLILASLVRIHPIFIPLFIIGLIFLIFFCGIMSNIYQEVAEEEVMTSTVSRFAIMHNILKFLPLIIGIFGTVLMIVMYKNYSIG